MPFRPLFSVRYESVVLLATTKNIHAVYVNIIFYKETKWTKSFMFAFDAWHHLHVKLMMCQLF
jgi:hypothetical protein